MSQGGRYIPLSGPGSGTVTSIAAGTSITLTPNPITTVGTVALTTTNLTTIDGTVYWDGTLLNTTATGAAGTILTSNGVGLAPTYQAAPAGGVTSIAGNTGAAQTGAISLITANSSPIFAGAAGTITLDFALTNNLLLGSSGGAITTAVDTTALGKLAAASITSGNENTFIGYESGVSFTTGSNTTAVGAFSMFNAIAGASNNTAIKERGS